MKHVKKQAGLIGCLGLNLELWMERGRLKYLIEWKSLRCVESALLRSQPAYQT